MSGENSQFSVLSLSGGGFRGLFTARVLAELEQEAGKPIGKCFDLICGTSVGGILALAIGLEKPMREIADTVERDGPRVFSRRGFGFFGAIYGNVALKNMVENMFGDCRIADSRHRLIIPAVNFSAGRPRFFKTAHHESFKRDYCLKMSDVAMATSAAPIYFPMYKFEDSEQCHVDGGLFANNPGLFGIHEAVHFLKHDSKKIHLLSIGTMGGEFRWDASKSTNAGLFHWGKTRLFLLTVSTQEKIADYVMKHQLGDERYHCIDELPTKDQVKNIGLDVTSKAAIRTLKSMGDNAGKVFIGSPKCEQFLRHSAKIFEPCHKLKGDNHDAKDA